MRRASGAGRRSRCTGLAIALALGASVPTQPARAELADDERSDPSSSAPRRNPAARVRALRMAELAEDPSSFTTWIRTEDYAGEHASLEELLAEAVGVQVRRFGGPGQRAEVSIRGSTPQQVVVLLDGVRLNSAQSGTVDLSTLPLDWIERIEVSRGGGSVQTGSDAVGGVINLVTRKEAGAPRSRARFAGGSFDTWEGGLSHSRALPGGKGRVALGYDGFASEGDFGFLSSEVRAGGVVAPGGTPLERVNNRSERHAGNLRVSTPLGPRSSLSFGDQLGFVSRGQPGLDFGVGPLGGQSLQAHERQTRNVADLRLETQGVGEVLDLSLLVFQRFERTDFRDPMPSQGDAIDTRNDNLATGLRLGGEAFAEARGVSQLASLDLEIRRDDLHSNEFENRERLVFGASIQDEIGFFEERLRLIPALRYDDTEGFDEEWLPRLGVVVAPWPWLRLKANIEQSYRSPNFDELFFPDKGFIRGNPGLAPEEARNADVGIELAVAEWGPLENLRFEAAYFDNDIEESIVFQQVSPFTVAATNTGPARIRGFELGLSLALYQWVGLSANWTRLDTELDPAPVSPILGQGDRVLPGRADDEVFARLRVGPESGLFKLVGELQYTSEIPVSFSGNARVSSRRVWNASASLDLAQLVECESAFWPESLLLSAVGTNLADVSVRDAVGFPQPGRSFLFGVEAAW